MDAIDNADFHDPIYAYNTMIQGIRHKPSLVTYEKLSSDISFDFAFNLIVTSCPSPENISTERYLAITPPVFRSCLLR